jgi:alkanesulfonate monooxygenase SsuD/methylene tetrahydromethanopterin reductase-like flavin-dependent oxidoreductase (luciferase family)
MCGFGQGGVPTDWELFDLPDGKTQGLMTVEGIDMITRLWQTDPPFDFKGNFWHIRIQSVNEPMGIGYLIKPYQQPHPPIAMSIVRGPSMAARMAGQRGYIPVSTNLVPPPTVAQHWQTYCAGAEEAGRPAPDRSIWRVSRSILIGESTDAAWDHALSGTLGRSFEYLAQLLKDTNMINLIKHDEAFPDDEVTVEYVLKQLCIIGDVKEVKRQLEEVWEITGGFGTLLMIAHDWDNKEKWVRSMELLKEQVLPALPSL